MKENTLRFIKILFLILIFSFGIISIVGSGGDGSSDTTTTTTLPDGSTTTTSTTLPPTSTTTSTTSTTTTIPGGTTSTTTSTTTMPTTSTTNPTSTTSSTTSTTTTSSTSSTTTSTTTTTLPSQTATLEGVWATFTSGSLIDGLISFDASGSVTGGNWEEENDNVWVTGAFTGGQLAIDNFGSMTGNITRSGGITNSLNSGQLCPISNVAAFTGRNNQSEDGATIIIKRGSNYTPSGMDGDWFYSTQNQYGLLQVDDNGNVIGGEWFVYAGLTLMTGEITGGTLTFNSQGQIAGTVISDFPNTVTFRNSQLDEYKEIGAATVSDPSGNSNMLIVKGDATFSTSDLQGTWHLVTYYGPGNVSYSTMIVDSSGNVSGNISYAGGSLAIDAVGSVTGQVQTSDGHTVKIIGQMNANKDFAGMHFLDSTAIVTAVSSAVRIN